MGGTWEEFSGERFLLCCDTNHQPKQKGGERTHTLTINEMPEHKHKLNGTLWVQGIYGSIVPGDVTTANRANIMSGDNMSKVGSSQPHNNMPPYVTCYAWERVS